MSITVVVGGSSGIANRPEPIAARTALGRVGEADDLDSVIAFLLSDTARWITAQDIEASGGFNL